MPVGISLYSRGLFCVFVFKQKTAYEMRISDWSSDVCSSDLTVGPRTGDEGCPRLATPCPPCRYELARSATCSFCGPGGGDSGDRRRSPKLAPEMWGLTPGHFAIPFRARAPLKIRTCSLSRRAASFARLLKQAWRSEEHTSELQSLMRI